MGFDLAPYIRIPGLRYNDELAGLRQRGEPNFNRVYGTQGHYIEFGVVLAMVLPLAVHRALSRNTAGTRLRSWAAVALLAGAIPFSISRAGFLGLVIGLLVLAMAWSWRMRFSASLIGLIGLLAFQAVVPGLLGTIKSAFLNFSSDPSIQGRLQDYAVTNSYIADRPWLGRGPGTYMPELYQLLDNQFLDSLLELGLVGTAVLASVFLGTFALGRSVRKHGNLEDGHLGQAIAASAIVALVASFTFDSLSFATFAGLTFVLLGLAGALWRLKDDRDVDGQRWPGDAFMQPAWGAPVGLP